MDSDQGKLFIGGISWETSKDKLKEYFSNYDDVLQTVVMKDKISDHPRGFRFVVFVDPAVLDRVLQDTHTIDGTFGSFLENERDRWDWKFSGSGFVRAECERCAESVRKAGQFWGY
ncbi:heterogeneous nuclear ribonucleoprotein 1-like [Pyrus ussuriensis x Pyrus communis]|uniref:Heterogeneous nuclear ribonucleoprotein 1-like n=1 Tax=Pyrus ussuriensis x Pyrus communis TaxID=2448454 RepID=A0A5N5HGF0_9ROSA|nr:heterogeneous nuclear ribonucleoprotein 1-like [Pyrus ussuriensis x Pyrus communis]